MTNPAWLLQIFEVSNQPAQQTAIDLLGGAPTLTVHTTSTGSNHYLFVDCANEEQARLAYELVMCADSHALLLHTSQASEQPDAPVDSVIRTLAMPWRPHRDLVE